MKQFLRYKKNNLKFLPNNNTNTTTNNNHTVTRLPPPFKRYRSSVIFIIFIIIIIIITAAAFLYNNNNYSIVMSSVFNNNNKNENVDDEVNAVPVPCFSLLVEMKFRDTNAKIEFLNLVQPLIQYVHQYERDTTLSYELMESDSNSNNHNHSDNTNTNTNNESLDALLLERYVDKEHAYLTIHKTSTEFLKFRPQLQTMINDKKIIISGKSYLDSGLGYIGG